MKNYSCKKIAYGPNNQQFAKLYKPKQLKTVQESYVVVIVIHGGYWKDNHNLDSYATTAIVDYLQTLNVAIWNLEYRRMNAAGENVKAPWPAVHQDVADGIDYLREIESDEGLDLTRVLLVGHSAGGHLATWAASRAMIPSTSELYKEMPLAIQRTISIAGILNLFSPSDVDQPEQIQRLMGGYAKDYPERYLACDPTNLYKADVSITVMHGKQDTCVNVAQAHHYCQKFTASINQVKILEADHFSMLPHEGRWQEAHWQQVKQLINAELAKLS